MNLILTGAAEVRRLNREFLRKDRDTDVIAFDYMEPPPSHAGLPPEGQAAVSPARLPAEFPRGRESGRRDGAGVASKVGSLSERPRAKSKQRSIWGDVYVSAEAAMEQARERGIPPREELARLFLHGCLHLLGYRDGTRAERARLEAVQESLLPHALAPARSGKRR